MSSELKIYFYNIVNNILFLINQLNYLVKFKTNYDNVVGKGSCYCNFLLYLL